MVTPLKTGTVERVGTLLDDETRTGESLAAHIVKFDDGDPVAKVVEARVYGTPVTALCGIVFVPQRDPTRLPLCAKCKDVYEAYRVFHDDLPDLPPS